MASKARGAAALVTAITAVLALAWGGTAVADGDHHKQACASDEARGQGTTPANSFAFELCRTGDAPTDVTGTFQATGTPPSQILLAVKGPVTCAEVSGNTASFVYPIAAGSKPGALANTTEVLITAVDNGPGGAGDILFFTGPVPLGTFGDKCGPAPGLPLPVTSGDVKVTDRS